MKEKRKDAFSRQIALYIGGLVFLVALFITADEVFDLPSLLFSTIPTPINWIEAGIETLVVAMLGCLSIFYLRKLWSRRQQAEEALRESEERYRLLAENATDLIWTMDMNLRFTYVSPSVMLLRGYSVDEAMTQTLEEALTPASLEVAMKVLEEELAIESMEQKDLFRSRMLEVEHTCKDGSTAWVEAKITGLRDTDGRLIGILGVSRDITERKKAEEALRQSEERYRTILEEMEDFYYEFDLAGNYTFVNESACRQLGYSREELIGMNYRTYMDEDNAKLVYKIANQVYRTGKPNKGHSYKVIRKDGITGFAEASLFPLRNQAGDIIGFRGIARDITERKEAEQQLLTASKLASVGELAAGVAHELNNPLTGIMGYAQLLISRQNIPQDIKADLDRIYKESQRTARIVQNLLGFARRHKPQKTCLDLNELVERTLELRSYELRTSNIGVYTNLALSLPQVMADYHQVQQVILNMLINAEQALAGTKHQGKITITTNTKDNCVAVSIADNGPGISKENISKIFDPFFTTKEVGSGTGLGLSVCHGLITEHGGNICVESQEGKGATFTIKLPMIAQGQAVVKEEEDMVKKSQPRRRNATKHILIVDDEPAICDVLTRVLSEEGYQTDYMSSAEAALKKIAKNGYELCIIDLKMPGTSGKRLYETMKQSYPNSAEKVMFITGDTITPATEDFLALAGKPYLAKPFDSKEVAELVEKTLGDSV